MWEHSTTVENLCQWGLKDIFNDALMLAMKVETIIKKLGGARRVSELVGVSDKAVYKWKQIPPQHVVTIAKELGLKPKDLRPDVFREAV